MLNPERTGANLAERTIAPSNVSELRQLWSIPTNGSDFSAPIVVNNTLYFGSWNGFEYAVNVATGSINWRDYLGIDESCKYGGPNPFGISSTPAYVNGTLYLGGGDGYWYALDATTGAVEWRFFIGAPPALTYDWASALVYHNFLYIGRSSCFSPTVSGALFQVNLTGNHTANHVFYAVPAGEVGGGIWSTPAVDPATNTIWVTTGSENQSKNYTGYPPLVNAVVALNATNLNVLGAWQVSRAVKGQDSDMATTPALFQSPSGIPMVVATDKNGIAYALNRSNVTTSGSWGPIWSLNTSGGFSSATYEGGTLYLAGNGLYAVDPNTGGVRWKNTSADLAGTDSALTWANGIIYLGEGNHDRVVAFDAVTGQTLWSAAVAGYGFVKAEVVVSNGQLYAGDGNFKFEGNLTAFGIPLGGNASVDRPLRASGLNATFQVQAGGGLTPYHFQWAFGDGAFGSGAYPSHAYPADGSYTVQVWINDSAGRSVSRNFTIVVPVPPLGGAASGTPPYRTWLLIGGTVSAFAVVAAVVFLTRLRRRRPPPAATQESSPQGRRPNTVPQGREGLR